MRDLSLLGRDFEKSGERIEATDPRFQEVTDFVEVGKYTEAADAVGALLAENLYDVRLLGFYAYGAFHEQGPAGLPDIFDALAAMLRGNWETLPATDKRVVLANKSVLWMSQTMLNTLKYHQTKKDERWAGWLKSLTEARAQAGADRGRELLNHMPDPGYNASAEALAQVLQWLREQRDFLKAEALAQKAREEEKARAAAAPPAPAAAASAFVLLGQAVQLRGSAQFVELTNKLKAFELLVARKDFQKAALVSDDILAALEDFDPRRYFPELFSNFGALLNQHVQDIQAHWERKDSTEWKMLSQFYQVDLESFVGKK
ncbi:type VI secretion system protein IglI family protein [Myxococcaceae bacterium GXIMD 01537]